MMERISEFLYEQDAYAYSLTDFEKHIQGIMNYHNSNVDFIDVLFQLDETKSPPLFHITSENSVELFINLLDKYKNKFLTIEPNQWEFLLFHSKNDCLDAFINFYGNEYFEKIVSYNGENFTRYHKEHFTKLFLEGHLDSLFKIENMQFMHESSLTTLHTLVFFDNDKKTFINFMKEQYTDDLSADLSNMSSNWLQYNRLIGRLNPSSSIKNKQGSISIDRSVTLRLPSIDEVNVLNKKWGAEKTSQVISDYLNYQKDYLTQPSMLDKYQVNFDEEKMSNLISHEFKFNNCGSALCFGLKDNLELLSYFIVTGSVKQEDLLTNIKNKQLYTSANHYILNESLEKKNDASSEKKLKL